MQKLNFRKFLYDQPFYFLCCITNLLPNFLKICKKYIGIVLFHAAQVKDGFVI